MKYIITENKIENLVKEYILKNYDAIDVEFKTKGVWLGSGPNKKGDQSVEQKVVVVYINNIKGEKGRGELKEIKKSIWNTLINLFGMDFEEYGGDWDLTVYQVKREEI